ncbi:tRNA 2-thiouridine(34) synthase MnmA [Nitratifractor salsuginis]|uniref:tRNA-specific 2-thiouridylase MnmA n=1 Tax=Nitratifractor salsuginis (strain DSM 16511 / JCM 12458 / E9I37-1) TaxID=749222 RepID=E6WZ82_NITSE|nr:tRNA 2-thiouridine(34) synthase MnmA [Nitratifractor salsuginis]ADV46594.1 tRNA (5-methylaminomethyl-2-thiouridylate)-methyltransferase [Nitratifractor salsuginis DSM 16511]
MAEKKVLVGMSGGVDSTVAALLLQKEGYEVVGVYMKLHDNEAYHRENYAKARRVGEYLGVEVHFLDISGDFRQEVYDYFVEEYRTGRTPNPCVVCNRQIKFGRMLEFADSLGIEKVATGHYVRSDGRYIYMARDRSKDQSYFLAQVRKEVIPRLLFPLGEWLKEEVKAYAAEIPVLQDLATQKESSEICFVENDYTEVLQRHMEIDREGEVLNEAGEVVGTHKGYMHYTIGKRRGFTVRGAHDPHYVLSVDPERNRIVVGTREKLEERSFEISRINLFEDLTEFDCQVKVRYRTRAIPAHVVIDGERGRVELGEPVYGLARGQFAVFYDGERLLGGGEIL